MEYNLFCDDYRNPKDCIGYVYQFGIRPDIYINREWVIVRDYNQFVNYITEHGLPILVSFDHDLGEKAYEHGAQSNWTEFDYDSCDEKTGMDCAKWLVDYCIDNKVKLPECLVHSMNTCGRANIQSYLDNYKKVSG